MTVGDILTLDYKDKILIADKITSNKTNYYLGIGVNEEETDINVDDITFYREVVENGEYFLEEVENQSLLEELLDQTNLNNIKKLDDLEQVLENYYKENNK